MKTALPYLMLLLVGSVSTDQSDQSSSGEIHEVLREMTASLTELKCEVKTLKKENADQAIKLESQEAEINNLKGKLEVTQVAFSAYLSESHLVLGPLDTYTTVAFKHVVTNIGNAYNRLTGIFTAPVRGAYHFELHVGGLGGSHATAAVINKNGERTFVVSEHQTNGIASSSTGIILYLEVGDQVFVSLWPKSTMFDNQNNHSTFSGHLLFTM